MREKIDALIDSVCGQESALAERFAAEDLRAKGESLSDYLCRIKEKNPAMIDELMKAYILHLQEDGFPLYSWEEDLLYYEEIGTAFAFDSLEGISLELHQELNQQLRESAVRSCRMNKTPQELFAGWRNDEVIFEWSNYNPYQKAKK